MHLTPSTRAELVTFLPVILSGAVLFAMAKWGKAKPWQLAVAALTGVVLAGTFIGPPVHTVLSQLSHGWVS